MQDIALEFRLGGEFVSTERYGSGHINDTFVVRTAAGDSDSRFILQRINKTVFRDPAALMENVRRVTEHLKTRLEQGQTCLDLVPGLNGKDYYIDKSGEFWRMYRFIEGARSYDSIPSPAHAKQAAAAFGCFQVMLQDLPGPRLNETIADFHNTPARFAQFHQARERDAHGRTSRCRREIDWVLEHEQGAGALIELQQAGDIPERITHNDTKINNVMFDIDTDRAVCVIDLDTVMPGLAPYDFGDLVRTATSAAAEDETDVSKITMRMEYYEALVEGYLGATANLLNDVEVESLPLAARIITIETGLRFLTDHLSGDSYFRVQRPEQNLERCRAQFALAASIDEQLREMQQVTAATHRRCR